MFRRLLAFSILDLRSLFRWVWGGFGGIRDDRAMRHPYADFIDRVTKPARYLGGEYQSVTKDPSTVDARVCLAFPDVYDIGMSHLGTKILYSLLNRHPRIACERTFAPWLDMEEELRARGLPLMSLESHTRLTEFDVIGISLQYEMTFTNVLTLLDLGGLALRSCDRAEDGPLVLVGGPTASHPEPVAPFIDAAFLGEGEDVLPPLVLAWAALRAQIKVGAVTRREALIQLASKFPVYVPALYATFVDEATGMTVVGAPNDPRVPARVRRAVVLDLDKHPFPTDAPVPYAEAVFERASVEIARGCTEGCRFCQAGMLYRPVRERSPESIIASVIGGVDKAGYEETGLTCLSTADFSSITPLVKTIGAELRKRGVSMSVASLRAYGLGEEILDEMAQTRISGLTFAPEAGTQRMRDVVNKNVTEAHVEESSRRVFSRGWHRLKLYFMIGLPTEEDEDVRGIVHTGEKMLGIGRQVMDSRAEVTVSVSSHVPKPHTPFQWAAQDSLAQIQRKQGVLRNTVTDRKLRLKYHDAGISFVEGVLARGDRRIADVIEEAWRRGARFDGWDECFDLERWRGVFDDLGVDVAAYQGTRPVTARLPWDHLDVGLEDGFLLAEYRKAVKSRLSPPCGKVAGMTVHHTNLEDASADDRKLVCYDCGVACDLSKMREDRLVALRTLGAVAPVVRVVEEVPVGNPRSSDPKMRGGVRADNVRKRGLHDAVETAWTTYRLRFTKLDRAAFLGHLDLGRLLARSFRRAELPVAVTRGFSPKPRLVFGPALGLGVPSLAELVDVDVEHVGGVALPPDEVGDRLGAVLPVGLTVLACDAVPRDDQGLGRLITAWDLLVQPVPDGMAHDAARLDRIARAFLAQDVIHLWRAERTVDVRALVSELDVIAGDAAAKLCRALDWEDRPLLRARVACSAAGSAKPIEVARALGVWGAEDPRAPHARIARLGLVGA